MNPLFLGIDGQYHRLHMCGLPKEIKPNDGCKEGIFTAGADHHLDGIFCECGNVDGCNNTPNNPHIEKRFIFCLNLLYIYLNGLLMQI